VLRQLTFKKPTTSLVLHLDAAVIMQVAYEMIAAGDVLRQQTVSPQINHKPLLLSPCRHQHAACRLRMRQSQPVTCCASRPSLRTPG
jgi:hypothetical protein